MARKRMVSVRLAPAVADQLDARAAAAGQTRTEWIAGTLARAVLTSAGRPVDEPVGSVDRPRPAPAEPPRPAEPTMDLLVAEQRGLFERRR